MEGHERDKAAPYSPPRFRLPFVHFFNHRLAYGRTNPVTLTDLRMGALSYALRSKPDWSTRYKDPVVGATWEKEALKMEIRGARLTEAEVTFFPDELQGYEKMRDETTGIQARSIGSTLRVYLSRLSICVPVILLPSYLRSGRAGF